MEEQIVKRKFSWTKFFKILILTTVIISSIVYYSGNIATHGLKTKEYKLVNNNIGEFHGFKIVHISDLHYGKTTFEKDLKELKDEVNKLKADIIFFTGDLIDSETKIDNNLVEIVSKYFKEMQATYGKYAVSGNHDVENFEFSNILGNSNFKILNNTYDIIYNSKGESIFITGISSNLNDNISANDKSAPSIEYLNSLQKKPNYSILLLHEPDYLNDIKYSYDLALAGHSHNGQIKLPFIGAIITPVGSRRYYKEYYKVNNTNLYISSGIGTSKVGFRLFNKPSINFYRITKR